MKRIKSKLIRSIVIIAVFLLLTGCSKSYSFENIKKEWKATLLEFIQTKESTVAEEEEIILLNTPTPEPLEPTEESDEVLMVDEQPMLEELPIVEEESHVLEESTVEPTPFLVTSVSKVLYPTIALNVRTGPSTSYERIGTLIMNQSVEATGVTENLWYEIKYNGNVGYCSGKYLSETKVTVQTVTPLPELSVEVSICPSKEDDVIVEPTVEPAVIIEGLIGELLTAVNADRAAYGLSQLTMTAGLQNTAAIRAQEAFVSFSHTRPDGTLCFTAFPSDSGASKAENLHMISASTTAAEVESSWMNSEAHKENIINSKYTKVGIGVYQAPNGYWYFVQDFSN